MRRLKAWQQSLDTSLPETSREILGHRPEFQVRVRGDNGSDTLIPIWIPLSIMAAGTARALGEEERVAQVALDALMAYGNSIATNKKYSNGSIKVDAMGQVTMAAKKASYELESAGGSQEAAQAVEHTILGWGGFLVSYIYANHTVILNGIEFRTDADVNRSTSHDGGGNVIEDSPEKRSDNDGRDLLWKESLATFHSSMSIHSSCSQPKIAYSDANVHSIPLVGREICVELEHEEESEQWQRLQHSLSYKSIVSDSASVKTPLSAEGGCLVADAKELFVELLPPSIKIDSHSNHDDATSVGNSTIEGLLGLRLPLPGDASTCAGTYNQVLEGNNAGQSKTIFKRMKSTLGKQRRARKRK